MKFKLNLYDSCQGTAEILDATQSCKELRDNLRKKLSECGLTVGDFRIIRKDNQVFERQDETPLCECGICQGEVLIVKVENCEFVSAALEDQSSNASADDPSIQNEACMDYDMQEEPGYFENCVPATSTASINMVNINRFLSKPIFVSESDSVEVPENLERLISSLDEDTAKSPRDLLVTVLYTLMLESGFIPVELPGGVDENQYMSEGNPHEFNVNNLQLYQSVPTSWKDPCGLYKISFVIRPLYQYLCRLVIVPVENTVIVNLLVASIDKGFSLGISSTKYVTNPTASSVAAKFQNLRELSMLYKNQITFPTRTSILAEVGINYASLPGLPNEIKLKILKFLPVTSLLQLSETCLDMYVLACDHSVWRYFMFRDFPYEAGRILQKDGPVDWKEKYKAKYKAVKSLERREMRRQTLAQILPGSMADNELFPFLLERPFGIGRQSRRRIGLHDYSLYPRINY